MPARKPWKPLKRRPGRDWYATMLLAVCIVLAGLVAGFTLSNIVYR